MRGDPCFRHGLDRHRLTPARTGLFQHRQEEPDRHLAWIQALASHWYFTPNTIDQPSQQTAWARHGAWDAGVQRFADADVDAVRRQQPGRVGVLARRRPALRQRLQVPARRTRRGMQIIAIDPRRTRARARIADLHLQVQPGEDPTLLAGMVRVILEEELCDRDVRRARTSTGVDALRAAVADFTPDYVAARTGVAAALMDARRRGSSRPAAAARR